MYKKASCSSVNTQVIAIKRCAKVGLTTNSKNSFRCRLISETTQTHFVTFAVSTSNIKFLASKKEMNRNWQRYLIHCTTYINVPYKLADRQPQICHNSKRVHMCLRHYSSKPILVAHFWWRTAFNEHHHRSRSGPHKWRRPFFIELPDFFPTHRHLLLTSHLAYGSSWFFFLLFWNCNYFFQ